MERNYHLLANMSNYQQSLCAKPESSDLQIERHPIPSHSSANRSSGRSIEPIIGMNVSLPNRRNSRCVSNCKCSCHTSGSYRSPRALDHFLGALFLGYSGCPVQKCTEQTCKARSDYRAHVKYYFPSWFLERMLSCVYTISNELSMSLVVRRVRPASAEIFRLIALDDINGLRQLFTNGSASPNDLLYPTGTSALLVSIISIVVRLVFRQRVYRNDATFQDLLWHWSS